MEVKAYSIDGRENGALTLNPEVFGVEPNTHLVYQAVRIFRANQRQGTAKSKERSEVSGGGKKPWRQKGRGTARAGSSRSPLWVGGGTVFGPRPRDYRMRFPIKMRQIARKSAYSMKAADGQVRIVDDIQITEPKTRQMMNILKALKLDSTKTLLLTSEYDRNLWLASRNIPTLRVLEANKATTYDLLNNQVLLIQKSALDVIDRSFTRI